MFRVRIVCLGLTLALLLCCGTVALATQVDCDATYCFTSLDFSQTEEPLAGICITQLPTDAGALTLGARVLQPGDILTAEQLCQMTFRPLSTKENVEAVMSYLPIYEDCVAPSATMTISIRGKENKAPVAQDSAVETYKNLPNEDKLHVVDPEGETMTYTLVRAPRRGDVQLQDDGSFTYTPKKNKVGVDSFTYTATDPAGNVSREATVTVQILKPVNPGQYTDTVGLSCRFEAEWLRNTGLFEAESVGGESCFLPEKPVSRGEFLAMMVQLLDMPTKDKEVSGIPADTPQWLKPYLAAAQRSGLLDQLPVTEIGLFEGDTPITGGEAAVMLQNALDLSVSQDILDADVALETQLPVWAASALTVMADNGVNLPAEEVLTRADVAELLYQASILAVDAPGTAIFRMNR